MPDTRPGTSLMKKEFAPHVNHSKDGKEIYWDKDI
jgi:hypothetical protein